MAKAKVVTPDNLGNTFKKDESNQKYQVNIDNSTITVNEQGQLVSNSASSTDEVVWTGNVNSNQTIALSKSCLGKTLSFFLVKSSSTNLTDPNATVYIASIYIPTTVSVTGGTFEYIFHKQDYDTIGYIHEIRSVMPHLYKLANAAKNLIVTPTKDGLSINISTNEYVCKQITMS